MQPGPSQALHDFIGDNWVARAGNCHALLLGRVSGTQLSGHLDFWLRLLQVGPVRRLLFARPGCSRFFAHDLESPRVPVASSGEVLCDAIDGSVVLAVFAE